MGNVKLGRNYTLYVQTVDQNGPFLTFTLPLTLEFDIVRKTLSSNNTATFRIYNLSLAHRNACRFNFSNYGTYRRVILKAGYGTNTPVVFQGNITQAWSVREGNNYVTEIAALDGGFAFRNGEISEPFPSGTGQRAVVQTMLENLPNVSPGAIGPSIYTNSDTGTAAVASSGASYVGSTVNNIFDLTNGAFFVDREIAHCLGPNEFIQSGNTLVISSTSGLLGTPVLEETLVHFDMIFEPSMHIGYAAQLNSITGDNFNGLRKITAVHHRGTISDAVCGDAITTGEFAYFNQLVGVALP